MGNTVFGYAATSPAAGSFLYWIPGLPLAAFAILIFVGGRIRRVSAWLSVGALAGSFILTLAVATPIFQGQPVAVRWSWLSANNPLWTVGFSVDGLSWLMLLVVTSVGTMIQLYSIGYMHGDPRFSRFFAYLSLFCASMLILVMADHFLLLYVGWELVGLCSYLLISFWFERPAAAAAGRKAFITTRLGDTGLLVGILLLAWTAGELRFDQLETIRSRFLAGGQEWLLTLISALIFFGAVGKSAQIPLHVWLPDAMEGPTPVSALIHAATMVAAGVYLVARTLTLFTPDSLMVVLIIGLLTHILAATVALTMTDIKRVLAYSTISQLGLMMTALGLGAMAVAMFHLMAHAYFKALLFLGAGSVIHATNQQDLGQLRGLRRTMPWTAGMFLLASLSMSGIFPLSGFWSKDAILLSAEHTRPWVLWWLLAGAALTAGYIFRLYLRCFEGRTSQGPDHSPHARPGSHDRQAGESPWIMVLPMGVLTIGAVFIGLTGSTVLHLLGVAEGHAGIDVPILIQSTLLASAGIWLAWIIGVKRRTILPRGLRGIGGALYTLAANKYYVDEAYDRVVIRPILSAARQLSAFDQKVIDGGVDRTGRFGWLVGQGKEWFDRHIVDRFVNGLAYLTRSVGALLRRLQTGLIHQYLFVIVASVIVISLFLRR